MTDDANDMRKLIRHTDLCLRDAEAVIQLSIDEILMVSHGQGSRFELSLACIAKLALAGVTNARTLLTHVTILLEGD